VFVTVPPEISSRAVVSVPLFLITIVPELLACIVDVIFAVPDTVIFPVELLIIAWPLPPETVPPEIFIVPVELLNIAI